MSNASAIAICTVPCIISIASSIVVYKLLFSRLSQARQQIVEARMDLARLTGESRRAALREMSYWHYVDSSNVVYSGWNSGFFSNCTTLLWCLSELYGQKKVIPRKLSFINGFEAYRGFDDLGKDLYSLFFEEDTNIAPLADEPPPFLDHHGIYNMQRIDFHCALVRRWFNPSSDCRHIIAALLTSEKIIPEETVAVLYRGTDKGTEVSVASPAVYARLAKEALARIPNGKVLIQTDQEQVRDYFKSEFGERCVYFSVLPVTSGNTVIHMLGSKALGMSRTTFAQHLIAVVFAVSKCRYVINHTGNMALWVCLYRGSCSNVIQVASDGRTISGLLDD